MTSRSAPRAATWLLERFGNDSRFQPLIGDLAEQFGKGRSRLWYWHQTMGAVAVHLAGALRTHGASFMAALLAGCALNWLLERCCTLAFQPVYQNLARVKLHPWSGEALLRLSGMVGNTLFWCALCFACAWLVTRIHRAHQRAVLVVFTALQLVQSLPGIAALVLNAANDPRLAISLATQIILTGLNAVFTLVAGLWAIRTQRLAQMTSWIRVVAFLWVGQVLLTSLLSSARRVGDLSYGSPEGYLSMYAVGIAGGLYLTFLLWHPNSRAAPIPEAKALEP